MSATRGTGWREEPGWEEERRRPGQDRQRRAGRSSMAAVVVPALFCLIALAGIAVGRLTADGGGESRVVPELRALADEARQRADTESRDARSAEIEADRLSVRLREVGGEVGQAQRDAAGWRTRALDLERKLDAARDTTGRPSKRSGPKTSDGRRGSEHKRESRSRRRGRDG